MLRIDELTLDYPFAGGRMLQGLLIGEGYRIGRVKVRNLMKSFQLRPSKSHIGELVILLFPQALN